MQPYQLVVRRSICTALALCLLALEVACQGPARREPVLDAFALTDIRLPQPTQLGVGYSPPDAIPTDSDGHYPLRYTLRDWYDQYNAATTPADRTAWRNRIAFTFLTLIKHYHEGTTDDLYELTATISSGFDLFSMVMGTLGGVTGDAEQKSIYAALAALGIGTRASLSRNILAEQTTSAILQQMDAMRLEQEARVRTALAAPDSRYSLAAALTDLYDYYTAGSVKDAVAELAKSAQQSKDRALARRDAAMHTAEPITPR